MKQLKDKEYEEFQQYLYNKTHGYIWTPETLELICGGNDNDPERIGRQHAGYGREAGPFPALTPPQSQAQLSLCSPLPASLLWGLLFLSPPRPQAWKCHPVPAAACKPLSPG